MAKLALLGLVMFAVACNQSTTGAVASGARQPTPTAIATSSPNSAFAGAKPVAIDGAVNQTGARYLEGNVDVMTACPSGVAKCLAIESEVDGDHAAYFPARVGSSKSSAACFIYTFTDATGWHFLDMVCARPESGGSYPEIGEFDYVFVGAGTCANVRATPGLGGKVIACLKAETMVNIDAGPSYVAEPPPATSHLWWHIQNKGWMAHDFLIPS